MGHVIHQQSGLGGTANPNGETLVLNSDFPSMQQVFAQTTPASKKVA